MIRVVQMTLHIASSYSIIADGRGKPEPGSG